MKVFSGSMASRLTSFYSHKTSWWRSGKGWDFDLWSNFVKRSCAEVRIPKILKPCDLHWSSKPHYLLPSLLCVTQVCETFWFGKSRYRKDSAGLGWDFLRRHCQKLVYCLAFYEHSVGRTEWGGVARPLFQNVKSFDFFCEIALLGIEPVTLRTQGYEYHYCTIRPSVLKDHI